MFTSNPTQGNLKIQKAIIKIKCEEGGGLYRTTAFPIQNHDYKIKRKENIYLKMYKFMVTDDSSYDETRCPETNEVSTREPLRRYLKMYEGLKFNEIYNS